MPDVFHAAVERVVKDKNLVATLKQPLREMRSDEARAACNQKATMPPFARLLTLSSKSRCRLGRFRRVVAIPAVGIWVVAIGVVIVRRARIHRIEQDSQHRLLTPPSKSCIRVKASFGVSPLRTTISTPSARTQRITASVAAMMGGESITMNL